MEVSPFPHHGPLDASEVRGRDELIADLVRRITSRRVTALLGPRRYGKTSVLGRVAAELSEVTTVSVDLYEVTSMADVAARFDDALSKPRGRFAAAARSIAASVELNLGVVKVELSGPARNRPDPALALQALLDVLVGTAQRVPTLLVVDEFSSIARVDGAAGALRTALQHHYGDMGIVFAGSQPSMMRALFSDRLQPFYAQADLVEIGPLSATAVEEIVADGFARTGRDAGAIGGLIYRFTEGHPHRSMELADACWRHTPGGATAEAEVWSRALDEVRRANAQAMEWLYSGFERGERNVLRAVARSGSIFGVGAGLLDLAPGTAAHARRRLLERGDLMETEDGLRVVDPVMADWLRQRFPL